LLQVSTRKPVLRGLESVLRIQARIAMTLKTAKASTRKSPRKPATKAARSRPAGTRTTKQPAQVARKTVASQLPRVSAAESAAAKKKFEQGILARDEAVLEGKPLPAGATHEIVGKTRDGSPILKRKRFSLT
jgi:phage protein D